MDTSSQQSLSDVYLEACVDEPDRLFDFRKETKILKYHVVVHETHTNKPIVWAVPNLMTREECDTVLEQVESHGSYGKDVSQQLFVKDIFDDNGTNMEPLSEALLPRLQHDYNLHKALRKNAVDEVDEIDSVSPTWRVLKLKGDEEFPAHRDGMDTARNSNGDGGEPAVSTHSVLFELQREPSTATGGAIRFYYRKYPCDGPYDCAVDVNLPQGWALVFEQRPDLWYALQPLQTSTPNQQRSCRYVAQAGMLQTMFPGETVESKRRGGRGTFSLAPGLYDFFEDEVERCHVDGTPRGWGEHAFNPKTTLWRAGRPILQRERRWSAPNVTGISMDDSNQSIPKTSTRRLSLQAQVDPIRGQVAYVEGRRPVIPKAGPTKPQTRPILDRRASMVDLTNQNTVGRERVQRRHSLQMKIDPTLILPLPQPAATVNKKIQHFNGDDSTTSITADFSESFRSWMEDDITPASSSQQKRRSSIQVTRQPRRDSLVGKLMTTFQATA